MIKDGEVKAADIATDAVGAAELQGVSKLLFGQFVPSSAAKSVIASYLGEVSVTCNISGVDSDDSVTATLNGSNVCFVVHSALPVNGSVSLSLLNNCETATTLGSEAKIGVVVFDK